MKKEIKFYAITSVLQATEKDALYAIKSPTDTTFRLAVTDLGGTVVYLSESNLAITSTDGSIDISTIASTKDLKVSTALQNAITNALQSGDPISSLLNDAGYLTSFTESDPIFLASEASNFVDGDKDNLDNQSGINTGDETIITIQAKRPLKTINNNSIEGAGNLDLITGVQSVVAGTNVSVDNSDPLNPIVSASGGGGSSTWGSITGTLSAQTDLQNALNLKEDVSNKSNSVLDYLSTIKFPTWNAVVSYFDATKIKSILGISTLSGSNTGDETTVTIQTKRPLKTINGNSVEGSGDLVIGGGGTAGTLVNYQNPLISYTTGTTVETQVYSVTIPGGELQSISKMILRELIWKKAPSVSINDYVFLRISTNGIFSTSLPVIRIFSITPNSRTDFYKGVSTFLLRSGLIAMMRTNNYISTDIGQTEYWTQSLNPANNFTIHVSVVLGDPGNGGALESLVIDK